MTDQKAAYLMGPESQPTVVITVPDDDVWTCDKWTYSGVWTTKAYALLGYGGRLDLDVGRIRWVNRSRGSCGTLNPVVGVWSHQCRGCGFPRRVAERENARV